MWAYCMAVLVMSQQQTFCEAHVYAVAHHRFPLFSHSVLVYSLVYHNL